MHRHIPRVYLAALVAACGGGVTGETTGETTGSGGSTEAQPTTTSGSSSSTSSGSTSSGETGTTAEATTEATGTTGEPACGAGEPPAEPIAWDPGQPDIAGCEVRGFRDYRAIIHLHSHHSHDACDGEPQPGGVPDEECLQHLRDALCVTRIDVAFTTDHPEHATAATI